MEHPELSDRCLEEQLQEETESLENLINTIECVLEEAYNTGEIVIGAQANTVATEYWYRPAVEEPADYWRIQVVDFQPEESGCNKHVAMVCEEVFLSENGQAQVYPVRIIEAFYGVAFESNANDDVSSFIRMWPEDIVRWSEYILETAITREPLPEDIWF